MKTNKKAILGFAVAMIFSLGFMQGMSTKSNQDVAIQQLGGACAIGATYAEDGGALEAGLNYGANVLGGCAGGMAGVGIGAAVVTTTNPVGWGYWVATGVVAL